jgi:hypothetical protein
MRRSTLVLLALGGLLIAGCGSTTPVNFKGKSRPAPPIGVSVYLSGARPSIDPTEVSKGPVEFNITNQTGRTEGVAIVATDGRVITESPPIAPGGTAQLKASVALTAYGVEYAGRPSSMTLLSFMGRSERTGNSALLQP